MGNYRCHGYTLADKKKAVEHAAKVSVKSASRQWDVQPKTIRDWRKMVAANPEMPTNFHRKKTVGGKKTSLSKDAQTAIVTHVELAQKLGIHCSTRLLRLNLLSKQLLDASKTINAMQQQIRTFLRASGYSHRKKTTSIPNTREVALMCKCFVSFIIQQMMRYAIPPENVWNFDQTNLPFAYTTEKTIATTGSDQVCVTGGKTPTQRATVMVGVNIPGKKSAPLLVFKGTKNGRIKKALEDVNKQGNIFDGTVVGGFTNFNRYTVNETAWMCESAMHEWIEFVWKPIAAAHPGPKLIMLDDFAAHQCKSVYAKFGEYDTMVEIVPGGLTGRLQVRMEFDFVYYLFGNFLFSPQ